MPLRLVMMGTGEFAVPTFEGLYDSPHEVVGLVTQPDRTGRGHHQHVNPMKQIASSRGTDVFQPERVNTPESLTRLRDYRADLFVVAAYGQILSADLLHIPRLGAINVHASLLPRHRGAAPINYAILSGDESTGITIFQIEPRLDAGPMLAQVATPIGPKETAGELETRLSKLAAAPTRDVIDRLEAGTAVPLLQDGSLVSKAPSMPKSMGAIDWTRTSVEIERHIRAMQPWPKPFTFLHQSDRTALRVLILDADPVAVNASDADHSSGAITRVNEAELIVRTGDGAVEVRTLQPAGKRAMSTADFLRGHSVNIGDRFLPVES